jgi:hypothetical protein
VRAASVSWRARLKWLRAYRLRELRKVVKQRLKPYVDWVSLRVKR